MNIFSKIPGFVAVATVALVTSLPAQAETRVDLGPSSKASVVKTAAGKGAARFDWLNPGKPAPAMQVAVATPPGNGSWICSPSGFGSKSKCYRR